MTKRQELWLEIAEAFGTPRNERTERQDRLTRHGLCWAISTSRGGSLDLVDDLVLFEPEYAKQYNYFWFPKDEDHDAERSTFACLMAALSDEDYKELTQGKAE